MHPLHKKAIELGKTYLSCEPMLLETIMEMAEENLFVKLGFMGPWDFLIKEIHLSESQASYFHRVAQRARGIPELKEAVVSGKLSLSQARRIVGVINPDNASEWIEAAQTLKQKALERKVSEESPRRGVREAIVSISLELSKLTVVMTVEEEEKLERARDLVSQSLQKPASYQQTLGAAVNLYLEKKDPVAKAERASLRTSKGHDDVPSRVSAGYQARTPIPAPIRHTIWMRDQGQCCFTDKEGVRCPQKRWIDLHHIKPVATAGDNTVDNLVTLCRSHHRFQHEMRT